MLSSRELAVNNTGTAPNTMEPQARMEYRKNKVKNNCILIRAQRGKKQDYETGNTERNDWCWTGQHSEVKLKLKPER